jgi:hypothetical protein
MDQISQLLTRIGQTRLSSDEWAPLKVARSGKCDSLQYGLGADHAARPGRDRPNETRKIGSGPEVAQPDGSSNLRFDYLPTSTETTVQLRDIEPRDERSAIPAKELGRRMRDG